MTENDNIVRNSFKLFYYKYFGYPEDTFFQTNEKLTGYKATNLANYIPCNFCDRVEYKNCSCITELEIPSKSIDDTKQITKQITNREKVIQKICI